MPAVRGAVGMRRCKKGNDNQGLVGSQFRIVLHEKPEFSGIFGNIIMGLELVDLISTCGDKAGKPSKSFVISACGKL